jgi:uncharacterized iron-regulated protein
MSAIVPNAPSPRRLAAALLLGLLALSPIAAAAPAPVPPPVPPWTAELGRDHPLAGRIWLMAERRFVTVDELVGRAAKARWVILGEKHDDADHHALQAYMLRRLIAAGRRPVVAFEQFESDKAPAIAGYLRKSPRDAAGLGAATGWDKSGWPDWRQYSPIAQAALDAGLPLVAANIPADEARAMARREPVDPDRVTQLSLDQPLPRDQYQSLLEDIRHSHCGMLPEHAVASMAMAQRARDGGMARALVTAAQGGPRDGGVLITGNGHARIDRGVPAVLGRLAPPAASFSLAFLEVEDGNADPDGYGRLYDAIWFTARTDGEEPCARMSAHLRKKP